jgi:hypothetical protein
MLTNLNHTFYNPDNPDSLDNTYTNPYSLDDTYTNPDSFDNTYTYTNPDSFDNTYTYTNPDSFDNTYTNPDINLNNTLSNSIPHSDNISINTYINNDTPLCNNNTSIDTPNHTSKNFFHNPFHYKLTKDETYLLNSGLKCILPPPPATNTELLAIKNKLIRDIRLRCHFHDPSIAPYNTDPFRIPNPDFIPPISDCYMIEQFVNEISICFDTAIHNNPELVHKKYTRQYQHAEKLRRAGKQLLHKGLIIKPTDKNLGLILLCITLYLKLGHAHVDDRTTYHPCNPPTLDAVFKSLITLLSQHRDLITPRLFNYLTQMNNRVTVFTAATLYFLPKMHKPGPLKSRPIASNSNYFTLYPSKFLHTTLYPLLETIPTYLTSSTHLITILEDTPIPTNAYLCSYDIESLYPSIPITDGLNALKTTMQQAAWPTNKINLILALAEWVLTHSYVSFDNQTYKQDKGTAMGTSFAVTYSNIFVHQHEIKALLRYTTVLHFPKPHIFFRLIDDSIIVVDNETEANALLECLNHSGIVVTGVTSAQSINFLDITIFKGTQFQQNNTLNTKIYQKPMNTYGYIPHYSFHTQHIFTNFIKNELRRYHIACTNPSDYNNIRTIFKKRLLARAYPTKLVNEIFTTSTFHRLTLLQKARTNISNLFEKNTIDPNEIKPFTLHLPHTTRYFPSSVLEILHKVPEYVWSTPLSHLIFNKNRPFIFANKLAKSNLNLLSRSNSEAFYAANVVSDPHI